MLLQVVLSNPGHIGDAELSQRYCVTKFVLAVNAKEPISILGKISLIYLSINYVPNEMSNSKFLAILNHTHTFNSPIYSNNKMVSSIKMGSIVAVRRRATAVS